MKCRALSDEDEARNAFQTTPGYDNSLKMQEYKDGRKPFHRLSVLMPKHRFLCTFRAYQ